MTNEMIRYAAERLSKCYQTRDPFRLCDALGINVMPLVGARTLKGMYRIVKRNRYLFLSDRLDECYRRIVCAHELGHDRLHADMAKETPLREFTICSTASRKEYEANLFAAELLLPDDAIVPLVMDGADIYEIASRLSTDQNLVAIKIESLRRHMPHWHATDFDSRFLR